MAPEDFSLNKKVILIGCGGHANSLYESFSDFIDGYIALEPSSNFPLKYYGDDNSADHYISEGVPFHIAYVYSGKPEMGNRKKIIELYEHKGAKFKTFIATSAIVSPRTIIRKGCAIMAGVILNDAQIDQHTIVNTGAIVEHDVSIGENCFIGPGAIIGGFTKIGVDCFIGLGAKIINGIKIADGVTVGMGSIVTKSITEPGVYYGVI